MIHSSNIKAFLLILALLGFYAKKNLAASGNWSVTSIGENATDSPESVEVLGVSDSQVESQLNQAMVNYFHELQSGKSKSATEREALWEKFVGPAERKFQLSQNKIFKSQRVSPYSEPSPVSDPSSKPEAPHLEPPKESEKYQDRPTFELDGSAIPKEIIFPAPDVPSKKSKSPQKSIKQPKLLDPHLLDSDLIPIYQ